MEQSTETTLIGVLSADPVVREALTEAMNSWGCRTVAIPARMCGQTLEKFRGVRRAVIVADLREQPQEAAKMVLAIKAMLAGSKLPLVLVMKQPKSTSPSAKLQQAGVVEILGEEAFELQHLWRLIERLSEGEDPTAAVAATESIAETEPAGEKAGQDVINLQRNRLYSDDGVVETDAPEAAGEVVDAEALTKTVKSRAEMKSLIKAYTEAKAFSANLQIAIRLCRDSSASVDDVAAAIKRDQALTIRVLQMANSAGYRRGRPVTTIEQAAVRIGLSAIRRALVGVAVLDQFQSSRTEVFDPTLLWEHSFSVAMIAASLARASRVCDLEDAYVSGLLHDTGKLVMLELLGDSYIDALVSSRRLDERAESIERKVFEMDHADAAGLLLENWGLAESTTRPIACHHLSAENLKHLEPGMVGQVSLLKSADAIAHITLLGDSGSDWIDDPPLEAIGKPIPPPVLRQAIESCIDQLSDIRMTIASISGIAPPTAYRDTVRASLKKPVQPVFVSTREDFDPIGVLFEQIKDDAAQPNIIVLHCAAVAGLPKALERLKQQEEHLGCSGLPILLILGRTVELTDKALPADRVFHKIKLPSRVTHIMRAINEALDGSKSASADGTRAAA